MPDHPHKFKGTGAYRHGKERYSCAEPDCTAERWLPNTYEAATSHWAISPSPAPDTKAASPPQPMQ